MNDRCKVAKILRAEPRTIVFVFAGRRQTGDKSMCAWHVTARHVTVSVSGFLLKKYLCGIPLIRERASGWREIDENMCQMSRRQLIFEGVFL